MNTLEPAIQVAVARTREQVARLHEDLVRYDLVVWTSGDISARVPGADLFVIKPSAIGADDLSPENLVLCDLNGAVMADTPGWDRDPSDAVAAHSYLYRADPSIGSVVHTHSTYATAWAARGEAIPCVLMATAREFGGEIPVGPLVEPGDESVGRAVMALLESQRSRAVLMQSHGLFTVGVDAPAAVRAAVLAEDTARTTHIAQELGLLASLAPQLIDRLYEAHRTRLRASTFAP